jgi:hypothetical protein
LGTKSPQCQGNFEEEERIDKKRNIGKDLHPYGIMFFAW